MWKIFCRRQLHTGKRGEQYAVAYLKRMGYRILERNYFNQKGYRLGEIDIIARDGDQIVFVEVKTHQKKDGVDDTLPELNVTPQKLHKIERIAQHYLYQSEKVVPHHRFDVVAVCLGGTYSESEFRHYKYVSL